MKYSPSRSLASRLIIYVLSFTLVVFAIVVMQFYNYSRKQVTDSAIAHTHGLLSSIAIQISSELQIVETIIKQSAWMVEANIHNPDLLPNILTPVIRDNSLIIGSSIAFVPGYYQEKGKYFMLYASYEDEQEKEISVRTLGGASYDYPYMDWFLVPKLLKQSYWSEPYYDTGGGNSIISTYALPLLDPQGEVYAVLTADISLSHFTDMISELKPYSSSYTFLLSRNGSYLSHPEREKIMNETIFSDAFSKGNRQEEEVGYDMLAGHTGTSKSDDGKQSIYAFYTTIANNGWSVGTICPSQVILHNLDAVLYRILFTFFTGVLVLLFFIYQVIRRQIRPLEQFSESARSIATGRFDITLPDITSKDEIKDLHDSLAYMQQSLSSYVSELRATTAAKERFESELFIAREIQMGMIPKIFPPYPEREDIDLYAVLQPAKEVGGDLYDFFIHEDRLYFIIGDVSGKGVPASLFMAISRSLFRMVAQQSHSPSEIMTRMNRTISDNNEANMFITLVIGILDLQTGKLRFCNAGHNPPLIINADGKVCPLESEAQIFVGILDDMEYTDEEVQLEKDARLFLYTDGISEAENSAKELYGEEHLIRTLQKATTSDAQTMVKHVINSVAAHVQQAEASDDITVLVIHYQPEKK